MTTTTTTDAVFQRALSNMLTEIFDGPPGKEAFVLNTGDPGLFRQLDTIDSSAASKRPMSGKSTIAAHTDHLHFGLSLRPGSTPGGSERYVDPEPLLRGWELARLAADRTAS